MAAPPIVQNSGVVTRSVAGTTFTLTLSSNVSAGNLIVVLVTDVSSGGRTFSAADDQDATAYTMAVNLDENTLYGRQAAILYKKNVTGKTGATTVTVTASGNVTGQAIAYEISGADTTAPVHATSSFQDASGTTTHYCAASTAIDTTDDCLIFTVSSFNADCSATVATNYTSVGFDPSAKNWAQYRSVTGALTDERAGWTEGSSRVATSVIAAFKAAAATSILPQAHYYRQRASL